MQIYWKPNIGNEFRFEVKTPEAARGCLEAIADFDLTLPKVNCNVGGCLVMGDEMEWEDWIDSDGDDILDSELIVPADDSVKECMKAYRVHLEGCGLLGRSRRSRKTIQEGDRND